MPEYTLRDKIAIHLGIAVFAWVAFIGALAFGARIFGADAMMVVFVIVVTALLLDMEYHGHL